MTTRAFALADSVRVELQSDISLRLCVNPVIEMRPSQIRAERFRAIWLGLTASVLSVIALLNAVPSNPVLYMYQTRVFASPQRVTKLQELATPNKAVDAKSNSNKPRALIVTKVESIATEGPKAAIQSSTARDSDMQAVRVVCFSAKQLTASQLQKHLLLVSEPKRVVRKDTDNTGKLRWARWRLEVAQRSLKQIVDEQTNVEAQPPAEVESGDGPFRTASTIRRDSDSPFQVASTNLASSSTSSRPVGKSTIADLRKIEAELRSAIESEEKNIQTLEAAVIKHQATSRGFLTLSSEPKIRPESRPLNLYFSFTLLVASGIVGWLMARLYFQSAIPRQVSVDSLPRQLESIGVKFLGDMIAVPASTDGSSAVGQAAKLIETASAIRVSLAPRAYHLLLARCVDTALMVCVVFIITRAIQDSHYRSFLAHNPLPALGRLLSGM